VAVGAPETDAECPNDRDCDSGSAYVYTPVQDRAQQTCLNALNLDLARVAQARERSIALCLRNRARLGVSAATCLAATDPQVEKAQSRTIADEAKRCFVLPTLGATSAAVVNAAAVQAGSEVVEDLFGPNLDLALVTQVADRNGARCQQQVAKAAGKCLLTKIKEFNRCKKAGLKSLAIQSPPDLEACLGSDPRGRIARACDPTRSTLAIRVLPKLCVAKGVDLSGAFPGCGSDDSVQLATCLDEIVECRVCLALNEADNLSVDCDLFDDGQVNASCP
jgi:hypothetical protein